MGSNPAKLVVPLMPKPKMPAIPAMPALPNIATQPVVMPPAAPQDSPTAQAGNAVAGAKAIGTSQGMNNTNLTGPQGLRLLEDQTQPRSLLGL